MILQKAQEFGLNVVVHFGNFIQKQGTPIGLFTMADVTLMSPGKRAFFMAKQGAFDEFVGMVSMSIT
jgi:hypothetical protein